MAVRTTHVAWDRGEIDMAFDHVFGSHLSQKSSKTMCGIRVSAGVIDNYRATCDHCRRVLAQLDKDLFILQTATRSMLSRVKEQQ